jgi:hypothetical protein
MKRRHVARTGAVVLALCATLATGLGPAGAAGVDVVSANPADHTPRVTQGVTVNKTALINGVMYAGGEFSQIQNAARTQTYDRSNFFAFDPTTGEVSSLDVDFNGAVWAITSDGTSLYVGGTFNMVNGIFRRGVVKINPSTGAVDTTFNANLNTGVREAQVVAGRLIISGEFTKHLQAVDLATGADTGYIDLDITGDVDGAGRWLPRVFRFAVNPSGTLLAAVGNFTTVSGQSRPRAFLVNLGPTSTSLNAWRYPPLGRMCEGNKLADYMRDVAWSPDGSYFVFVSTGFVPDRKKEIGTSLCDAAARFETSVSTVSAPTWINYTGGDTLLSVAISGDAVYVQGHQRWLDNPYGKNEAGPGAVSRPGIGAIDPVSGLSLPWNPTKDRGEGGKDLLITSHGLWVPSDTTTIGGEIHERLALMPGS